MMLYWALCFTLQYNYCLHCGSCVSPLFLQKYHVAVHLVSYQGLIKDEWHHCCEPGWKFPPSAIEWFQCQGAETLKQDIIMNPNNVSLMACHNTPPAAYTHATVCKQTDEFNFDMIYSSSTIVLVLKSHFNIA